MLWRLRARLVAELLLHAAEPQSKRMARALEKERRGGIAVGRMEGLEPILFNDCCGLR